MLEISIAIAVLSISLSVSIYYSARLISKELGFANVDYSNATNITIKIMEKTNFKPEETTENIKEKYIETYISVLKSISDIYA